MTGTEKALLRCLWLCACVLTVALGLSKPAESSYRYAHTPLGASVTLADTETLPVSLDVEDGAVRVALRLQRRLRRMGLPATIENTLRAVYDRQHLLRQHVRVHFTTEAGNETQWMANIQEHPLWIRASQDGMGVRMHIDRSTVHTSLSTERVLPLPAPKDAKFQAVQYSGTVSRIVTDTTVQPGYVLDIAATLDLLVDAFIRSSRDVYVALVSTPGRFENLSGLTLGDLHLLATGHSNFRGSPPGRIANIRKALREHVNNTLIAPGEVFSFNATLGEAVSLQRGWKDAKVINGGVLIIEPGGGICQVSTTVFRSILQAGLPVLERKSHSMYVSYYEQGGVGLDATVYIGHKDLTFLNDTGNYLVLQAYDDGDDAYVRVYGTPDGRVASIAGPYFTESAPADFHVNGRTLKRNEIGWRQEVRYADGRVRAETILSSYKELPRSVVYKYTALSAR